MHTLFERQKLRILIDIILTGGLILIR
jgi:hypothetical protein